MKKKGKKKTASKKKRSSGKKPGQKPEDKHSTDLKLPNFEDKKNEKGEQPKEYVERLLKENFEELSKSENYDSSEIETQRLSMSTEAIEKPSLSLGKIPRFRLTKKVKVGILLAIAAILVVLIIVYV